MTGYRIGPVKLRNFGPFAKAEYDFSAPGLTCIEGEFIGHGCDSNASGKSYLIEAPFWCIWGSILRGKCSAGDVIRLLHKNVGGRLEVLRDERGAPVRPEGGCSVETHLVGGPKAVKIIRYEGHPKLGNRVELYVGGKNITQGRDSMTQEAIEQIVGMDFRTATNSIAYGAGDDVRSFFTATDSARKAIMDRILGYEIYSDAEKVARARHKAKEGELSAAQMKLDSAVEALTTQERLLAQVVSDEELLDKQWRVRLTEASVRCLVNHRKRLVRAVERAHVRLERAMLRDDKREQKYQEKLTVYEVEQRVRAAAVRDAQNAVDTTDADIRVLTKQLMKWDKLAGKKCPTCRQVLEMNRARKLWGLTRKKRRALKYVRTKDQAPILRRHEAALKQLHAPVRSTVNSTEEARHPWTERHRELSDHDVKIERERERQRELERDLRDAERRTANVVEEVAKTRKGIKRLEEAIRILTAEVGNLAFWVSGFGNGGIKSFLIENEIPQINKAATRYAQRLMGQGTKVQLAATRTLKTGGQREEMVVSANIPGCTINYATASKSQKGRLDLCLLLALRDTVSRRNARAFDQFFADELFDGVDETGQDFVIELLRELCAECPMILVTHVPRLKSIGDRIIKVRHEDGVSTVETNT